MSLHPRLIAFANHSVVVNTFHLAVMRLLTFTAPLLTLWHLLNVLNLDGYGVVAFGMAVIQLAALLTDAGLTLAAIQKASRFRDKKRMLGRLSGGVTGLKLLGSVIYSTGIITFAFSSAKYAEYQLFFLLLPISVILIAVQPGWLFLGIERANIFTRITILGKTIYLAILLLLVQAPEDYILVVFADATGNFIIAALSIAYVRNLGIPLSLPTKRYVSYALKSGLGFFIARIASASYQNTAIIVLGIFSPPSVVAVFSVAEQFYKALSQVFSPLVLALYAYLTRSKDKLLLFRVMVGVSALLLVVVAAEPFAVPIVLGLLDVPNPEAVQHVLFVLMFALVFQVISSLAGYPLFTLFDRLDLANKTILFGSAIYLALVVSFSANHDIGPTTIAYSLVATEASILIARLNLWGWLERRRTGAGLS